MSNDSMTILSAQSDRGSGRGWLLGGLVSAALLAVTASALSAHEGHQDNMTDAEMATMEQDMSSSQANYDGGDAGDHSLASDAQAEGAAGHGQGLDAPSINARQTIAPEQILQQKIEENRVRSLGDFLGRIHPIAAHFPIALLIFAALVEFALWLRPALGLQPTVRLLVAGGAIGAAVAALLGWFAAGWRLADRSETLAIHRWNGTALALVSLLAWWLAARGTRRFALRVMLALIAAGLIVQGYLGGEMVFGPNHLGLM